MTALPLNFYDLVDSFHADGCVVCRLVERDVERYLDSHLYEFINTPETHAALRASRGLCATHSEQATQFGASVLGIAILHSAVLDQLLKEATASPAARSRLARLLGSGTKLAERLEPGGACIACEALKRAESQHVTTIAMHIDEAAMQQAYRESSGLCLPHFRATLRAAPNGEAIERLLEIQTVIWEALKRELDLFADQYDTNYGKATMGEEGDSWRRALRLVGGAARVQGLRRDE